MAEESPQPVNPAVNPQAEDPPSTAVPVAAVDLAPAEVNPGVDPQVPAPQPETATTPPAAQVQSSPAATPDATPQTPAPAAPPPPASQVQTAPAPAPAQDYGSSGDAAALEQAQQAEADAFRQGRIPQPVTNPPDPQIPTTDGTTAGPGITEQLPGVSPYGEADDLPEVPVPQSLTLTESEVIPGFTADPLAAGENVGSVLTAPAPVGLTESEVLPGFTADPLAAGENVGSVLDAPRPVVGLTESEVIPEFTSDPRADGENVGSVRDQALRQNARNQQAIRDQRRNVNSADWRVRIRLAQDSSYLYNAADPGILQPLSTGNGSDGVIFPYTPTIQTVYKANYNSYDLTHSNYRGYFYQGSVVEDIQITGVFTAQDTIEAEYLLAVIHFFRSATKMFYGQDVIRGAPPPLVFLSAFGQYQYVDAPCVIASFNYNLPADVDYIRARSPNQDGTSLLKRRDRASLPPRNILQSALQRLRNARPGGLPKGGKEFKPAPPTLGLNSPTYVPTRMEITVVLHPVQSRQQVSQQFSLKEYSSGRLQPRGYW